MIMFVPFSRPVTQGMQQDTYAIVGRSLIAGVACGVLTQAALRSAKLSLAVFSLAGLVTATIESWRATQETNDYAFKLFFAAETLLPDVVGYMKGHPAVATRVDKLLEKEVVLCNNALKVWEYLCSCETMDGPNKDLATKVKECLKTKSTDTKQKAFLIALKSKTPTMIVDVPSVTANDFLEPDNLSQSIIDAIDKDTFDKLCQMADPKKGGYKGLWQYACNLDYLSEHALTFFKMLDGSAGLISSLMGKAIFHDCTNVVTSLLKAFPQIDKAKYLQTGGITPRIAAVIHAELFVRDGRLPAKVERETLDAIWARRSEFKHIAQKINLWSHICRFDECFDGVVEMFEALPQVDRVESFLKAIKNSPNIVKALLEGGKVQQDFVAEGRQNLWINLRNATVANLLQQHRIVASEHPALLTCVVQETTYPPDFSQDTHVRIILNAGVSEQSVREAIGTVEKLNPPNKSMLLYELNTHLDKLKPKDTK